MPTKRKTLSKRTRFEVFKRDSFTCQYCGQSAPSVVLHVDHIVPVSKGGKNDILNLITACSECNGGKTDRRLSDAAAVSKSKAQADALNERRNQVEMMAQWHAELGSIEDQEMRFIEQVFTKHSGFYFSVTGQQKVKRWIKKHKIKAVAQCMEELFEEGLTHEAVFEQMPKRLKYREMPYHVQKAAYLTGVARNRWNGYWEWHTAFKALALVILEAHPEEYNRLFTLLCQHEDIADARDSWLDRGVILGWDRDVLRGVWNDA